MTPEAIPAITEAAVYLADTLAGTDTRLIVVGGAGSLFVNPEHTVTVDMGTPDFPRGLGNRFPPPTARRLPTYASVRT